MTSLFWLVPAPARIHGDVAELSAEHAAYRRVAQAEFRSILPSGTTRPLVHVPGFALQKTPTTNGEFLAFVTAHPEWRRSRISDQWADGRYLQHWRADLDLGSDGLANQPVTNVSWFAARAFCQSHGARLPNWNEWELAAAANEHVPDARHDRAWQRRILGWYSTPSSGGLSPVGRDTPNLYGLHDLHGLIWEWVDDFNALFISPDNRDQGDPDLLKFCGSGALSVEDRENYPVMMRLAMLSSLKASSTTVNVGFRCALPGEGQYHRDVILERQDGQRTSFSQTHGRVRIVTMFYSSCPMACPLTIDTIRAIDRELTPVQRAKLDVLMVTFDPQNDSRRVLQRVAVEHRLDTGRWMLARTAPGDVRRLSAMLDIAYRKLDNGSFNHSSVLVLMDGAGRPLARSSRIGSVDPQFLGAIRGALDSSAAPQRVLHHDVGSIGISPY